jgi:hypothetical protein
VGAGGRLAAKGRAGGPAGNSGWAADDAGGVATAGTGAAALGWTTEDGGAAAAEGEADAAAGAAVDCTGVWSRGASSGVLCTGRRGAAAGGVGGAGGAFTAGIDALATGVPGRAEADGGVAEDGGGGGGGAVPTPNSDGEAAGEDGSAGGAACAACWALVRSATSESVSCLSASAFGTSGFGGTDAMFG